MRKNDFPGATCLRTPPSSRQRVSSPDPIRARFVPLAFQSLRWLSAAVDVQSVALQSMAFPSDLSCARTLARAVQLPPAWNQSSRGSGRLMISKDPFGGTDELRKSLCSHAAALGPKGDAQWSAGNTLKGSGMGSGVGSGRHEGAPRPQLCSETLQRTTGLAVHVCKSVTHTHPHDSGHAPALLLHTFL